jgi:hypothetical protein
VGLRSLGIRPFCPTPRSLNDLVREGAHRDRDGDVFRGKEGELVFPIDTRRRDCRVRQPVQRDVVEDVVSRKPLMLWDAYDQLIEVDRKNIRICEVFDFEPARTGRATSAWRR